MIISPRSTATTAFSSPVAAAATAMVIGAALNAAAGSVVSQVVGVATGIQEKFDWKGVALAAISGGVGGAVGAAVGGGNSVVLAAVKGAATSAISQGIGVALGLQDRFSWAAVAAAGVGAGVGQAVGNRIDVKPLAGDGSSRTWSNFGKNLVVSGANAIANAATRSLIEGTDFGDNIRASLPDVVGGVVGAALGGAVSARASKPKLGGSTKGEDNSEVIQPTAGEGGNQLRRSAGNDEKSPDVIVVIARKQKHDGWSTSVAQAAFVSSEARRTEAGAPVTDSGLRRGSSTILGLSLTKDQYFEAVKNDLWEQVQGDASSATGFSSNAEVSVAARKAQALPSVSTEDLKASSDLATFVKDIGPSTAGARIGGRNQNYEKFLTFGRNASGEVIVTGISLVGRQGGNISGLLNSDVIGIAHVHHQELVQPPNSGDNSIAKARNLPSFVIGSSGRNVWEIGRANGSISIRSVLPNNNFGRWEAFQSDADKYKIYNGSGY